MPSIAADQTELLQAAELVGDRAGAGQPDAAADLANRRCVAGVRYGVPDGPKDGLLPSSEPLRVHAARTPCSCERACRRSSTRAAAVLPSHVTKKGCRQM